MTFSEPVLTAVALGLAAFGLAASKILTAEAQRRLDFHRVQVKAITLRNRYAEQILALRQDAAMERAHAASQREALRQRNAPRPPDAIPAPGPEAEAA